MNKRIYLDHAAATPAREEVVAAMMPYFSDVYGNPSSLYDEGREANAALTDARLRVAALVGASAGEIIFTGNGTESINLAILGTARANQRRGKHIVTTTTEHHAVLHALDALAKEGFEISYVPVDRYGVVNPTDVIGAMREDTILVSVMYANNEIGSIQPIADIARLIKEKFPKAYFHSDACQAAGALDMNVANLGVDLLTANGSKIYGPKGTGMLYANKRVLIQPIVHGGGQEANRRSGTENLAGIVGFAKALELAQAGREEEKARLAYLRDKLVDGILANVPKAILNGHPTDRLPNNANITFLDIEGEALLLYLNEAGIAASTGSACTSGSLEASHVIVATGLSYEAAHGSMRFTLGRSTTEADVEYVIATLPPLVKQLRAISPINLDLADFIAGDKPIRHSLTSS